MKVLAKNVFLKMQHAWMNRDIDAVKDFISIDLYNDYKDKLHILKINKEKNILEEINVIEIKIISSEDYHDNSKDSFIAYIKGNIVDYTIFDDTKQIIKNENKKAESFTDTYHFIRQGNKWILNYIDNDVTLGDLMRTTNYKEK